MIGMAAGFRAESAPVVSSTIVGTAIFSLAVTTLSALRIPVSYLALLWCYPAIVVIMVYANLRFHQMIDARVVLIPSARLAEATRQLGG